MPIGLNVKVLFRHPNIFRPRLFSTTSCQNADFTHAIIGAGVVGLAIARRLQQVEGAQVVLLERHGMVGTETSSRNSEVSRHRCILNGKGLNILAGDPCGHILWS
jgi:heterodisulfide reductase subunit A-like polyferredoxin